MSDSFADVLRALIQKSKRSIQVIADLSGVPYRTLTNWVNGNIKKPQDWQPILKVAEALELSFDEANKLLQAASHRTIAEQYQEVMGPFPTKLNEKKKKQRESSQAQDIALLTSWLQTQKSPFLAPPDIPHFVGRKTQIEEISEKLLNGRSVALCSVQGMGGIGKTALAAHLAYTLRPHFADGVLWARLDTSDPMSILALFAQQYDRDVSGYKDLDSRATAVRALLADKRVLMILDNVENSTQLKPFLPANTGKTAVIVTSRVDIASINGLVYVELPPFDVKQQEALALFAHFLTPKTLHKEKAALREIADLLGHLPLAIAITAAHLERDKRPVADYLAQMRHEKERLAALRYDDYNVRLSFDLSYRSLPAALQSFFAALGTLSGADFDAVAVAAITETAVATAATHLETLVGYSLLQRGRNGRYRLHPLLRDYAKAHLQDSARYRYMVDYFINFLNEHNGDYLALSVEQPHIMNAFECAIEHHFYESLIQGQSTFYYYLELRGLFSIAKQLLLKIYALLKKNKDIPPDAPIKTLSLLGTISKELGEVEEAETYLRQSLTLAEATNSLDLQATCLGNCASLAFSRGNYAEAETLWQKSKLLSQKLNKPQHLFAIALNLGVVAFRKGNNQEAKKNFQEALALSKTLNDFQNQVALAMNIGNLIESEGDYKQAEAFFQEGLEAARHIQYLSGVSSLLIKCGEMRFILGDFHLAKQKFEESLQVAQEIESMENMSAALADLGNVAIELREFNLAQTSLEESLKICQKIQNQTLMSEIFLILGKLNSLQGDNKQAMRFYKEGWNLAQELGIPYLLVKAGNGQGECCLETKDIPLATQFFEEAYQLSLTINNPENIALSLYGRGRCAAGQGQPAEAVRQGRESFAILSRIGHYKAQEVGAWLATLEKEVA